MPKTMDELLSERPSFTIVKPEEIRCLDCGFLIGDYFRKHEIMLLNNEEELDHD
jgi:hypothetical protein